MSSLLTFNGIPPQVVGSISEQQRSLIIAYGIQDRKEGYNILEQDYPEAIQPMAAATINVVDQFVEWGASVALCRVNFVSSYLDIGQTTFMKDKGCHSDHVDAWPKLREGRFITLRLICPSSNPALFGDFTGEDNMQTLLDQHRMWGGRFYGPELLALAEEKGQIRRPNPWDIMAGDMNTPHDPQGVSEPHRRILMNSLVDMFLPSNWEARVKNGDVPRLHL